MRELAIGKVAPEIVGEDLNGKPLKLSDFRGKVVMLSFWGTWCGPCMGLVAHERSLVKRLEGKPFVLIGVNSDRERESLKPRLEKEQISWRSFWNGSKGPGGPIAKKWNIHLWPTVYVLDQNGVIRYRYIGSPNVEDLEKAIDALVQAAKKAGTRTSSSK